MKALDSLFNLVHSLSDSEKKYFRIQASRHVIGNKNNYEKLFDLFCQLPADKPYDEAQLKKLLKGKSFGKNLAVEKKNLYDLVLESMRMLHAHETPENKLLGTITDLLFLYNKGLHSEARKELVKGFSLAKETENLSALIWLYKLKQRLTRFTQTEDEIKEADKDFEEEKNILSLLEAERRISNTRRKIYNLYSASKLKQSIPELQDELERIMKGITSLSPTFNAQSGLLTARALIAEKEGEYLQAMKLYEQVLDLWEQNPLKVHEPTAYIRVFLGNYLVCAHYCERFDIFPSVIDKIEKLLCESITEEAEAFLLIKQFQLVYMLNSTKCDGCDELINDIEKGFEKYASFISHNKKIEILMNIDLLYLQQRRFNELIGGLNKTFELIGRDKNFNTMLRDLKFFEIMAHISLKNHDLFTYQLDNTERWLREHEFNNEFTIMLLKILRRVGIENNKFKINGQLTEVNCPQDMLMLREVVFQWLKAMRFI